MAFFSYIQINGDNIFVPLSFSLCGGTPSSFLDFGGATGKRQMGPFLDLGPLDAAVGLVSKPARL